MSIDALFDEAFFTGVASTGVAPLPYPCAINGRGYVLDFSFSLGRREAVAHRSIQMLRPQADTSNVPGEQSLNPEGPWRRTQNSWHSGAGQDCLDRPDSIDSRFRSSKGINPWDKWRISLLGDTSLARASANTNLLIESVGSYRYVTDGAALLYTTNFSAFTNVTGMPAGVPTSIASDGYNVWVACTASGLYTTTRGAAAATQQVTTALAVDSVVGYVKGRLMVSKGAALYNVTAAGPAVLPAALFTQNNSDFVWVGFAEGPGNAYAAGYSGDKSLIYRLPLKADGTGLDVPIVAGELPDGEIVRSIRGYLGFIVVGTDLGWRWCQIDSDGAILLGDLVETDSPVLCFEPQSRFIWYGLTNYDATSTGLGRMDLRTINGNAPAYASDLMATTQGAVTSVDTFGSLRVFAVSGVGFYTETAVRVATGTLDSGCMTYGLADLKVAISVLTSSDPLVGSYATYLSQDDGDFVLIGANLATGSLSATFPTDRSLTDRFELREVLSRADASDEVGPSFVRHTLRVNPAATTGYFLIAPIRLHESVLANGQPQPCVPSVELSILDDLRLSRRVVLYQEGASTYTVTVESLEWLPESLGRGQAELNGVCIVTMKTVQ